MRPYRQKAASAPARQPQARSCPPALTAPLGRPKVAEKSRPPLGFSGLEGLGSCFSVLCGDWVGLDSGFFLSLPFGSRLFRFCGSDASYIKTDAVSHCGRDELRGGSRTLRHLRCDPRPSAEGGRGQRERGRGGGGPGTESGAVPWAPGGSARRRPQSVRAAGRRGRRSGPPGPSWLPLLSVRGANCEWVLGS